MANIIKIVVPEKYCQHEDVTCHMFDGVGACKVFHQAIPIRHWEWHKDGTVTIERLDACREAEV